MALDITYGLPELQAVRAAARSSNWPDLINAINVGVRDDEDRTERVEVAVQTMVGHWRTAVAPDFEAYVGSQHGNATVLLLRGALEVERAWLERGFALARYTRGHRFSSFHQGLHRAEEWLLPQPSLLPPIRRPGCGCCTWPAD